MVPARTHRRRRTHLVAIRAPRNALASLSQRTEWNVRDSDATVVFTIAPGVSGGTSLTLACARRLGKPTLHLSRPALADSHGTYEPAATAASRLLAFLKEHQIRALNVAGPRGSQEPEIADFVRAVLQLALC